MLSRARDANLPGYPAQQHRTRESNQENEGSAYCVENQISKIIRSPLLSQIFTHLSSWLFKYGRDWTFYLKCGNEFGPSFGSDFRRVRMFARSVYYLCHVRPSVRMYQRGSHCTDFRKIWYCGLLWKPIHQIQNWLEFNPKNRPLYV